MVYSCLPKKAGWALIALLGVFQGERLNQMKTEVFLLHIGYSPSCSLGHWSPGSGLNWEPLMKKVRPAPPPAAWWVLWWLLLLRVVAHCLPSSAYTCRLLTFGSI